MDPHFELSLEFVKKLSECDAEEYSNIIKSCHGFQLGVITAAVHFWMETAGHQNIIAFRNLCIETRDVIQFALKETVENSRRFSFK